MRELEVRRAAARAVFTALSKAEEAASAAAAASGELETALQAAERHAGGSWWGWNPNGQRPNPDQRPEGPFPLTTKLRLQLEDSVLPAHANWTRRHDTQTTRSHATCTCGHSPVLCMAVGCALINMRMHLDTAYLHVD